MLLITRNFINKCTPLINIIQLWSLLCLIAVYRVSAFVSRERGHSLFDLEGYVQ